MNSFKSIALSIYAVIALGCATYWSFFGAYQYSGFATNLGRSLVWPAVIFPTVGKIIGGTVMVIVIGYLMYGKK